MDKQLAQHRTQEQGSRIATAAHLNYEFAMNSWKTITHFFYKSSVPGNKPGWICCKMGSEQGRSWGLRRDMPND
jgi:hypothetical protein